MHDRKKHIKRINIKKELIDFSFLLPALILFLIMVLVPFIQGIPLAFTNWNSLADDYKFTGLSNFERLFSDKNFINATRNTVIFAIVTTIVPNVLGLFIAILLQKNSKFNNFGRTVFFLPYCLSIVLVCFIWKYIFSDIGFEFLGIPNPLSSPSMVMIGISFICVWGTTGYCMVVYIAGLQSVPVDYYEVARIAGATPWQTFCYVTLPSIIPSVTTNVTLLIAWGMKVFDYPMAATQGGPGRSAETLSMLIYNNLFKYFKGGYGQAMALVFTVGVFIVSGLTAKILRSKEVEA